MEALHQTTTAPPAPLTKRERSRRLAVATHVANARARHRTLAALVDRAKAEGASNLREVADRLNSLGSRTPQGFHWDRHTLKATLLRLRTE